MKTTGKKPSAAQDLAYISLFAVIITICSWIIIPSVIPFTLQTLGIFLTIGVLGGRRGTIAVCVYIILGAAGIPVFSGFTGGIGVLFGNTGGYILGFLFSALLMWGMEKLFGRSQKVLAVSMAAGLLVCYLFGSLWFMVLYTHRAGSIGFFSVLATCVLPFILPDLLKIALALYLTGRIKKAVEL